MANRHRQPIIPSTSNNFVRRTEKFYSAPNQPCPVHHNHTPTAVPTPSTNFNNEQFSSSIMYYIYNTVSTISRDNSHPVYVRATEYNSFCATIPPTQVYSVHGTIGRTHVPKTPHHISGSQTYSSTSLPPISSLANSLFGQLPNEASTGLTFDKQLLSFHLPAASCLSTLPPSSSQVADASAPYFAILRFVEYQLISIPTPYLPL